ncbi:DUF5050 domain-containing protein [Paenibacillus humicola]|uniref:DUF5050 domain-containing protein n=1 Tax=Paenibacillus humicola TaxID=3110540 RepID=UPI00237AE44F|nr:DUF5050 domain-containing protein [Paenibacillus humicola]
MKKWTVFFPLSIALFSSGTSFANPSHPPIRVEVNDHTANFNAEPVNFQGTVYVPVRSIVNELGGQIVSWKNNVVTLMKDSVTISFRIGSTTVYKNQEPFALNAVPKLMNGTTFVPVRFFSEALGASVNYTDRRISIQTGKPAHTVSVSGNTIGNLNNGGWYASDQEWIYFGNYDDSGKLYKEKPDGSERQKISDDENVGDLNVVNQKLYYVSGSKLYKCDLDGSNRVLLKNFGMGPNLMAVAGDWIYYTEGTYMFKPLYRMKVDGTSKQLLEKYAVSSISIADGKIFYTIDGRKLFVMDTDGSHKKKLLEGNYIGWVDVKDRSLFLNYNQKLYSIGTDGTQLTKISDIDSRNINVQGEWLYYSNYSTYGKPLYRIHLNDHTNQKLSDDKTFYLHVLGSKIFFYNPNVSSIEELTV